MCIRDRLSDGRDVIIGGIMEHIEEAGVHSGDSACSLPPYSLSPAVQDRLRQQMRAMALELGVIGLMNAQFAIQGDACLLYTSGQGRQPTVGEALALEEIQPLPLL